MHIVAVMGLLVAIAGCALAFLAYELSVQARLVQALRDRAEALLDLAAARARCADYDEQLVRLLWDDARTDLERWQVLLHENADDGDGETYH